MAVKRIRWRLPLRWYPITVVSPFELVAVSLFGAFITGSLSLGPFKSEVAWAQFLASFLYMVVFTGWWPGRVRIEHRADPLQTAPTAPA